VFFPEKINSIYETIKIIKKHRYNTFTTCRKSRLNPEKNNKKMKFNLKILRLDDRIINEKFKEAYLIKQRIIKNLKNLLKYHFSLIK
jgi:hypothetical protein